MSKMFSMGTKVIIIFKDLDLFGEVIFGYVNPKTAELFYAIQLSEGSDFYDKNGEIHMTQILAHHSKVMPDRTGQS